MTVTVKKIGGSVAVLIPHAVARDMEMKEGTLLEITSSDAGIVLRRRGRRPRRPISEIVAQIKRTSYSRHNREFLKDTPVGKEIW